MSTVRIQVRRGSATDWSGVNPVLAAGELGVVTDTRKIKVGDGSTAWNSLSYIAADSTEISEISQDAINTALTMGSGLTKTYNDGSNTITITVDSTVVALKSYVDAQVTGLSNSTASTYLEVADRGTQNGVASLNASTKIPESELDLNILTQNISTSGDISAKDLSLTGNLTVNGTTTSISTANFTTEDAMIALADLNAGNTLDLGFHAKFNDGTAQYSGLVRDTSDNKWKLFKGVTTQPGTTVDFTQGTLDDLSVKNLAATNISAASLTTSGSINTAGLVSSAAIQGPIEASSLTAPSNFLLQTHITDGIINDNKIASNASIAQSKIAGLVTDLSLKSTIASPTFTGTVTIPSGASIDGFAKIEAPTFTGTVVLPATTSIGDVSATELSYLDGTTSSIQTQLTAKTTDLSTHNTTSTNVHGIADTSLLALKSEVAAVTPATLGLGNVTNTSDANKPVSTAQSTAIATAKAEAIADATAQVAAVIASAPGALDTLDELAAALGDDANFAASVTTSLGLKVDSLTPISQKSTSYTLSSLTERDDLIEVNSAEACVISIPEDSTTNYPIGTSLDVLQTGAGQVSIAPISGSVTVNATPGLKLRAQWSSCTLFKRAANTWVVYGDLKA